MNHRRTGPTRRRQRGIVTIVAAMLLAAGVIFILVQALQSAGTRSVDTSRQLDSTAALMLAESGLQRAQYAITSNEVTMTADVCTAFSNTGPFALGRGQFSYGVANVSPAGCTYTGTPCDSCTISATGTVGGTSRTLNLVMNMGVQNGVAGRGTTVNMVLKNTYDVPALGVFNLAVQRQSPGGNASASVCATCTNEWNVESSNGNTSVGGMGVQVGIAANTNSKLVTQTISAARDYAEVGALFPSTSSAAPPTAIGSYWNDTNGATGSGTVNNSGASPNNGTVNSGVATTSPATCASSPNSHAGAGSQQTCTSWCTGGDTLVFGVSGRSQGTSDLVNSVTFNTPPAPGVPAQNIAMTKVVHFPSATSVLSNASGTLFAEVWWAYNPAYTQNPANVASTYASVVYGSVGATLTVSPTMHNNDTSMSVSAVTGQVCVGDPVSASKLSATIASVPGGGTCSTSPGTYTVSAQASGNVTSASTTSTRLYVTSNPVSHGTLSNGPATPATSGSSVTVAGASGGNYTLATATNLPPQYFVQGTGNTVYVPAGTNLPAVGTMLAVYSGTGTGALAANTTVQSVGTNSYTLSTAPATPLLGASVCGGTCAMFSDPGNTGSTTQFTVDRSAGTSQWSGGFLCLSGVDASRIVPVTSGDAFAKSWQESIQ